MINSCPRCSSGERIHPVLHAGPRRLRPDSRSAGCGPALHPLVSEGETAPSERGECGATVTVAEKSGGARGVPGAGLVLGEPA